MSSRIRLVLAIHNHQPVGNFEGVFESAYRDSYAPFLEVLEDYPTIPFSLHMSGSLLEWLVDAHPEYIDAVRQMADRGQIEILGGPFYEPILASIPRADRVGQIALYRQYLEHLFGTSVRGMWVPERVWEQTFAGDISQAGIEYTILDDYHFRTAGIPGDQLYGYYLTEDEGRLLKVFPGSEKLRYTIPFGEIQDSINYLKDIADRFPNSVVAFGDDGEKFGTWPGTKEHVYTNNWLRNFLDALAENSDWLKVVTMAEAVDQLPPAGKCYLGDSSYREMTEWALPTSQQVEYHKAVKQFQSDENWENRKQFVRGGFWRNFLVKYPESNDMYSRMLQVSRRLEQLSQSDAADADSLARARTELYRGQCNCPYWHGAFGGLYLPHLRNAIYQHLIAADTHLEAATGRSYPWIEVTTADYNLDARLEVRIASDRLVGYFAPARGGHLYELDIRSIRHNLLATLNRRPELYHDKVRDAAKQNRDHSSNSVSSIHDQTHFKQPDLDRKLGYDNWPRKSLVDHFLRPGLSFDEFRAGSGEVGDFLTSVYESVIRRSEERVELQMSRRGHVGPNVVKLTKTVSVDVRSGSNIDVHYELSELTPNLPIHFAPEFNFAGMAAGASDRYYYDSEGRRLGQLETLQNLSGQSRVGLVDEWLGLDVAIEFTNPADIWTFPIQTVSQSEGGIELVHQSCAVVPHWEFVAPEDGRWSVSLTLTVDTSAAQARKLREAAAVR